MQRFKLMGLALMAIFALSAVASSTAFGEEGGNPLILPNPTSTEPLPFTSESDGVTKQTLETTKGNKIECNKATNKGSFTSGRLGAVEIDFTGCKGTVVGKAAVACNTKGDPKETILLAKADTDIHLVDVLPEIEKAKKLRLGVAIILLKTLIIECGVALTIEVKGSVIGLADFEKEPTTEEKLIKAKHLTLLFHQTKGEQEIKTCDLTIEFCGKESSKKFLLEAAFKALEFELAGQEAEALVLFEKEVEVHY